MHTTMIVTTDATSAPAILLLDRDQDPDLRRENAGGAILRTRVVADHTIMLGMWPIQVDHGRTLTTEGLATETIGQKPLLSTTA